jgi:P4 family phage/plasmid primase-like protien
METPHDQKTNLNPKSPSVSTINPGSIKIPSQKAKHKEQPTPGPESEADDKQAHSVEVTKNLLEKAKNDCGAPFEPEQLKALGVIKEKTPANFARIRAGLKRANKDISVVELDAAIKNAKNDVAETHHGYASDMLSKLTIEGWKPVAYEGDLYTLNPDDNIWVKHPVETLKRKVAETHDGKPNCERSTDYSGIANHVIMIATDDKFFTEAPMGLACPDGFYQIKDNEIIVEPLLPSHRQRVKLDVTPKEERTPTFDSFLHETFASSLEGEETQQILLLSEIFGAIMLGIMAIFHKAILFYDPFGRAGKGTLAQIIAKLVPDSFITAVSPFNWDKEYYLASLIGSRFNSVGELSDSRPIPAAAFKTVTGRDPLTGRQPNQRTVTFKNEAAHLFMSNHLINTQDHSEAFFTRWLIMEFPNSRLRSGKPINTGLAENIMKNELPGIAYWAMLGAKRLLANDEFSKSIVHDRLMAKWRHSSNSLEEFIHECCDLDSDEYVRRAEFYRDYKEWCNENGRKPFAKGNVKELLASNIGLGITHTSRDGYEIFRGINMKEEPSSGLNPEFRKQY